MSTLAREAASSAMARAAQAPRRRRRRCHRQRTSLVAPVPPRQPAGSWLVQLAPAGPWLQNVRIGAREDLAALDGRDEARPGVLELDRPRAVLKRLPGPGRACRWSRGAMCERKDSGITNAHVQRHTAQLEATLLR